MKKILCLFVVFLFSGTVYAADVLYVQSLEATIFGQPSFASQVLGSACRGEKLQVIETGEGWYKVSTGSCEGWINMLCVADHIPLDKVTIINEDTPDLENNIRKRASSTTSSAAARGLTPSERKRMSDYEAADYHALGQLITYTEHITDEEVEEFKQSQVNEK